MDILDEATKTARRLVDDGSLAGWVAGIVEPGHAPVVTAGGVRGPGREPMTPDTVFAIASCTKPMAGALAVGLAERGILDLDAAVAEWLPELSEPMVLRTPDAALDDVVPARAPITVRHLLTMTAGFGLVWDGPLGERMHEQQVGPGPFPPPMRPDEYLGRLAALPLAEQPGSRWRYHTCSDVLGVLVQRATGESLAGLLSRNLFEPLGMHDTGFWCDEPARMATALQHQPETGLQPYPMPDGVFRQPPQFESLATGLVSTVLDQMAFLAGLLDDQRPILSTASVAAMTRNALEPSQLEDVVLLPDGHGWGLHVEVRADGRIGWAGGLGTIAYADPRTGRVAVLYTQQSFESPGMADLIDDFLAATA